MSKGELGDSVDGALCSLSNFCSNNKKIAAMLVRVVSLDLDAGGVVAPQLTWSIRYTFVRRSNRLSFLKTLPMASCARSMVSTWSRSVPRYIDG